MTAPQPPSVIVHAMISADAKMEGLSPEGVGLYYELAGRLGCDTWLVGSDTLLSAEAEYQPEILSSDLAEERLPVLAARGGALLVVPDSHGRIRHWSTHAHGLGARGVVVLVSRATPGEYLDYLSRRSIPYIQAGDDHIDYREALAELGSRFGTQSVRTDSGGVLSNLLLEHGLVAELSLLVSPELVGDAQRGLFRTLKVPIKLELTHSETLGQGYLWLRYRVRM